MNASGIFLLTVRIVGMGWVWGAAAREKGFLSRAARIAGAGVLLNVLIVLAASAFQIWTPVVDWILWMILFAAGLIISRRACGTAGCLIRAAVPALLTGLLIAMAAVMPLRSEWLAGGWDPGLYQNTAVSIARHNGTMPVRNTIYAEMTRQERELATTLKGSFREALPGVPVVLEDGSLPNYLFPFTPVCGAWLYRTGGMDMLMRLPVLFAFLAVLPALALAGMLGLSSAGGGFCLLFWLLCPLWWYHQAVPTSEMPQLFLLCSAALFYFESAERKSPWPVLAGLALFAGTINRFDYPVFAGVILTIAAWEESLCDNPGRRSRILFCFGALACGIAWDMIFSGSTIFRLQEKDRVLWIVLLPYLCALLVSSMLLRWRMPSSAAALIKRTAGRAAMVIAFVFALSFVLLSIPSVRVRAVDMPVIGGIFLRTARIIPFCGYAWFWALGISLAWLAGDRRASTARLRRACLALALILVMLLIHGGIAPIYPWALRRYFVYALPLMSLVLGCWAFHMLALWRSERRAAAALGFLLLGFAALDGVRNSYAAIRTQDYRGLAGVLEYIAGHVNDNAVVVSDDPRWGTPLLLSYGCDVLDGKRLWRSENAGFNREYLQMLRRIQKEGRRQVLWLTSTDSGMGIYQMEVEAVAPVFDPIPFAARTVIHSERADHFAVTESYRLFGLYKWE